MTVNWAQGEMKCDPKARVIEAIEVGTPPSWNASPLLESTWSPLVPT